MGLGTLHGAGDTPWGWAPAGEGQCLWRCPLHELDIPRDHQKVTAKAAEGSPVPLPPSGHLPCPRQVPNKSGFITDVPWGEPGEGEDGSGKMGFSPSSVCHQGPPHPQGCAEQGWG